MNYKAIIQIAFAVEEFKIAESRMLFIIAQCNMKIHFLS